METIRQLDAVTRADSATVGTKAATLGELVRAGYPVPAGIVLTTEAYAQVIAPIRSKIISRVSDDVVIDPGEIETAAGEVRRWIEEQDWSLELTSELERALDTLARNGERSFAARTSLPSDELVTAFGSGVERAFLGLVGLSDVRRGVARCWSALWNSRSMYYRHRKKISQTDVALAVLIQPLVRADAAGVMFSQNRSTGEHSEVQIESIWGLGAPLTNARVTPDRFWARKADGSIRRSEIAEKLVRLTLTAEGALEQQTVADEQIAQPSLTEAHISELTHIATRIEELLGEPQDIEWARAGDQFFILQARPIALRTT